MLRKDIILIVENFLKKSKKKKFHISLDNRRFYNGLILNYEDEDALSFIDDKIGYMPIIYSHIVNIEPMREKEWIFQFNYKIQNFDSSF